MSSFIDHITDQSHAHCTHSPGAGKMRLDAIEHKNALAELKILIEGYVADCERYLHGHSTSSAAKRVNKERNWTAMYGPLLDAGVLERNEGAHLTNHQTPQLHVLIFVF